MFEDLNLETVIFTSSIFIHEIYKKPEPSVAKTHPENAQSCLKHIADIYCHLTSQQKAPHNLICT